MGFLIKNFLFWIFLLLDTHNPVYPGGFVPPIITDKRISSEARPSCGETFIYNRQNLSSSTIDELAGIYRRAKDKSRFLVQDRGSGKGIRLVALIPPYATAHLNKFASIRFEMNEVENLGTRGSNSILLGYITATTALGTLVPTSLAYYFGLLGNISEQSDPTIISGLLFGFSSFFGALWTTPAFYRNFVESRPISEQLKEGFKIKLEEVENSLIKPVINIVTDSSEKALVDGDENLKKILQMVGLKDAREISYKEFIEMLKGSEAPTPDRKVNIKGNLIPLNYSSSDGTALLVKRLDLQDQKDLEQAEYLSEIIFSQSKKIIDPIELVRAKASVAFIYIMDPNAGDFTKNQMRSPKASGLIVKLYDSDTFDFFLPVFEKEETKQEIVNRILTQFGHSEHVSEGFDPSKFVSEETIVDIGNEALLFHKNIAARIQEKSRLIYEEDKSFEVNYLDHLLESHAKNDLNVEMDQDSIKAPDNNSN